MTYACTFASSTLELGSQMSAGAQGRITDPQQQTDDGRKNGKGGSKGSTGTNVNVTQTSAGAYKVQDSQDGGITDHFINPQQKTLDSTDEGFTGKKGKGNSQGSSTSGTNMDVKKKPKVS